MRILLAEDNIVNQKVVQRMLEKAGYRADVVADGKEAVEAQKALVYDLILMDCQMPQMDGFEATRLIRNETTPNAPCRTAPILALTANAQEGDRERCLAAGMDDYLAKPFYQEELRSVVERWCDHPLRERRKRDGREKTATGAPTEEST